MVRFMGGTCVGSVRRWGIGTVRWRGSRKESYSRGWGGVVVVISSPRLILNLAKYASLIASLYSYSTEHSFSMSHTCIHAYMYIPTYTPTHTHSINVNHMHLIWHGPRKQGGAHKGDLWCLLRHVLRASMNGHLQGAHGTVCVLHIHHSVFGTHLLSTLQNDRCTH